MQVKSSLNHSENLDFDVCGFQLQLIVTAITSRFVFIFVHQTLKWCFYI